MKKFFFDIAQFCLFPLLYIIITFLVNYYFIVNVKWNPDNTNILIVGDSHTERGIDPGCFNSAFNISQASEPYYISFWKLREMINEVKFDTIIIGVAPHNFSSFNDRKMLDSFWCNEMFKRVYPLYKLGDYKQIKINYKKLSDVVFRKMLLIPSQNHYKSYIGKYTSNIESHINDFNKVISRHYYFQGEIESVSKLEISYLDSILNLCYTNEVQVIAVNTPVTKDYYNRIPLKFIDAYSSIIDSLKKTDIIIFDGIDNNYTNNEFYNSDHLNSIGAQCFTKSLINELRNRKDKSK